MGGLRGSGIPLGPAVCFSLLLLGTCSRSPGSLCHNSLNCPLQKREVCPPGSADCGPCIHGYKETREGKCVDARSALLNPEAAIDLMSSMLRQNSQHSALQQQENTTTSQAPPPLAPDPPAEDGPSGRGDLPGAPRTTRHPPNDAVLLGVVVACALAGLLALIVAGACWCRMRKEIKLAERTDYPAYKQSPPPYEKTSPGDKKLAQNAQMYHYQHQKQQMISMEKNKDELKHPDSAVTSDEENEDGDFTVYECPGLAPTGEMEVKNPLFDDSSLQHPTNGPH